MSGKHYHISPMGVAEDAKQHILALAYGDFTAQREEMTQALRILGNAADSLPGTGADKLAADFKLYKIKEALDSWLFQRKLSAVTCEWSPGLIDNEKRFGFTNQRPDYSIVISIDPESREFTWWGGETAGEAVLSVLLHEMVHAYLTLHACSGFYGPLARGGDCNDQWGQTSHGPAWKSLAAVVESKSMELFDLKLDLAVYMEQS